MTPNLQKCARPTGDSELSGAYSPDSPGLPRGRSGLPREKSSEAQRLRLHRAVIEAIAEVGYAAVTVNDVVARARVSRRDFYRNFTDMQRCFLSAALSGGFLLYDSVLHGIQGVRPAEAVRGLVRGYLTLCVREPDFAYCLATELPAAGSEGLALFVSARKQVAVMIGDAARLQAEAYGWRWHEDDDRLCLAAVGAVHELTIDLFDAGDIDTAMELEDVSVAIIERILGLDHR